MKRQLLLVLLSGTYVIQAQQPEHTGVPVFPSSLCIDLTATLGEGALYNYDDNSLYWVDIEMGNLYTCVVPCSSFRKYQLPERIGTVVRNKGNQVILAMESGIYKFDLSSEKLEPICFPEKDKEGNRFNDGKCSPAGTLWAGTMSMTGKHNAGSLYRIYGNGKYTKMIDSVTISNGITWSPDGTKMYYIDTPTSVVMEFDYNKEADTITNPRIAIRIPSDMGYPDGMTIDRNGNLWIAHWGGFGVYCWNPQSGKLLAKVEVPAKNVTSCAFGGLNFDTLFITTARTGNTPEELEKYPYSGSVFISYPGTKGVPSFLFENNSEN